MNKEKWFLIANEEMAILLKQDGFLVTIPEPEMSVVDEERHATPTGSNKLARTFAPGSGVALLLSLNSDGPVQVHKDLPADLLGKFQDILAEYSSIAKAQIEDALEDNLTPKQRENEDGQC